MRIAFTISCAVLLLITGTTAYAEDTNSPSPEDIEFFEKKVRPVLAARCYACHSNRSKSVKGGLKVDSREGLIAGGDSGSAIVPGKPQESLFIAAIQFKANADYQMPPKGKLPDHEIAALTEWVRRGAPFPGGTASTPQGERKIDFAKARKFWSFVPVEEKPLPKT
ncbi:MAG: c-type cytochrome, partial [Planctomycetaceae bacterium]|nr:c-type cytochrome [Planctomycetaceae bacterium]